MAKTTYNHYGKVVNGQLIHFNWPFYLQSVKALEGKEFQLVIKEKHKRVSPDTHGFYRAGIIRECMNYEMFGGWSEEDIHDLFSNMYLKNTRTLFINNDDGTTSQYPVTFIQSTSILNQKEMNEFVDKVIIWLAGHGIEIQSPESYVLGKFKSIEK